MPELNNALKVTVDFGGDEDNHDVWKTVSYCTPFGGSTAAQEKHWVKGDNYAFNPTSYGMWAVPPDVGNKVLVMFLGGNLSQGVWIGCLMDSFMNFNMPGMAAYAVGKTDAPCKTWPLVPAIEYDKYGTEDNPTNPKFRPYHKPTYDRLIDQGLIGDEFRGITTSSARREAPSSVFGISTPGPIDPDAEGVTETFKRAGGHTFVMDDGAPLNDNKNGLIRLRTRGGAQILLHDSSGFVYICNKDATAWVELDQVGNVEIYSGRHFSIRAEEDINIRADRDLNIDVGRDINLHMPADYKPPEGIVTNDLGEEFSPGKAQDPIANPIADGSIIYHLEKGHIHGTLDKGDVETDIAGYVKHLVHKTLHYHVIDSMSYHTAATAHFTSGGEMNVKAGGIYKETAPEIHMNGPAAITDIFPAAPVLPLLYMHEDVLAFKECDGEELAEHEHSVTRFPTREPYQYHLNENTRGIFPEQAPEHLEPIPILIIGGTAIKKGAISDTATKPLDFVDEEGIFAGTGFGPSPAFEPKYEKISPSLNPEGSPLTFNPSTMKVSEHGIDFIKREEGKKLTKYRDASGFSIGYGHFIKPGENFDGGISEAKAEQLLVQDTEIAAQAVRDAVKVPLTQNQFDALTSMSYNIGSAGFKNSTVVKRLNAGNKAGVPDAMMMWTKHTPVAGGPKVPHPGLVKRRGNEAKMFASLPTNRTKA